MSSRRIEWSVFLSQNAAWWVLLWKDWLNILFPFCFWEPTVESLIPSWSRIWWSETHGLRFHLCDQVVCHRQALGGRSPSMRLLTNNREMPPSVVLSYRHYGWKMKNYGFLTVFHESKNKMPRWYLQTSVTSWKWCDALGRAARRRKDDVVVTAYFTLAPVGGDQRTQSR